MKALVLACGGGLLLFGCLMANFYLGHTLGSAKAKSECVAPK